MLEDMHGVTWATVSVRVPRYVRTPGNCFVCSGRRQRLKMPATMKDIVARLPSGDTPFTTSDLEVALSPGEVGGDNLSRVLASSINGQLVPVTLSLPHLPTLVLGGSEDPQDSNAKRVLFSFKQQVSGGPENAVLPLDFLVHRKETSGDQVSMTLAKVAKVVLAALASRRWDIFTPDLAGRTYYVGLPPGLFKREGGSSFAAIPVLTLTKQRGGQQFRRSMTVSLLLFPCDEKSDDLPSSALPVESWKSVLGNRHAPPGSAADDARFCVTGDLKAFVTAMGIRGLDLGKPWSLNELLGEIAQCGVALLWNDRQGAGRPVVSADPVVTNRVWSALSLGVRRGAVLLIDDLDNRWLTDYCVARSREESTVPEVVGTILEKLGLSSGELGRSLIATPYGQAGRELICHFPDSACTLAIIDSTKDDLSTLRMLGALLSISAGLATVRSMIYFFHHEVASERKSETLSDLLKEFVVDVDEAYDLDLRAPWYKFAYERVKELSGLDRDFTHVKSSVETLIAQVSAAEVQDSTRATVALTGVIAIGTLAGFAFRVLPVGPGLYVVGAILFGLSLTIVVWIGAVVRRYLFGARQS